MIVTTALSMHTYDTDRGDQPILRQMVMASLTQHRLHRERTMTLIFNIIVRYPESVFFMFYRGFTLSATYERCFHREDGGEYSRGVGRVYDSEQPLCLLLLALKIKLLSRATMKHLY